MNFEFKSTFNNYNDRIRSWVRNIDPHVWVLFINLIIAITGVYIYLNNIILPATIGSHQHGKYYIFAIETFGYVLLLTSVHAISGLILKHAGKYLRILLHAFQGNWITILQDQFRRTLINIYLIIHLWRDSPRIGYSILCTCTLGYTWYWEYVILLPEPHFIQQ